MRSTLYLALTICFVGAKGFAEAPAAKKATGPLFKIQAEDRTYYLHRPKGCTVLTIRRRGWEGNEFGLWLPETIYIDGQIVWCNWEGEPHQDFEQDADGRWCWLAKFDDIKFQSTLEPDTKRSCLWYTHRFTNTGQRTVRNLKVQTCFHLVNAPQFISIRGERIWANLDGKWTTTDRVPRSKSPDPHRVGFLRQGQRTERTVVPNKGFPSAIMPEAAHHPLIIAEAFAGKGSVGLASRDFLHLFNNNDYILRCIHSAPKPIPELKSGQTKSQDAVIVFCDGDHQATLQAYESAVSERWAEARKE